MTQHIVLAVTLSLVFACGNATAATWSAEALGEGSGLDRGVFAPIASTGSAAAATTTPLAQSQNSDDSGVKASRREMIEVSLAESLARNEARLSERDMMAQANMGMGAQELSMGRFATLAADGIHAVPAGEE